MIGDKSKSSVKDIKRLGGVYNRSIELYPNINEEDLELIAKAKKYNDKVIIVDDEIITINDMIGGVYFREYDTDIIDFSISASYKFKLTNNIFFKDIINLEEGMEYNIMFIQDKKGGRKIEFDYEIPLNISNIDSLTLNPHSIVILKIVKVFNKFYGHYEIVRA